MVEIEDLFLGRKFFFKEDDEEDIQFDKLVEMEEMDIFCMEFFVVLMQSEKCVYGGDICIIGDLYVNGDRYVL